MYATLNRFRVSFLPRIVLGLALALTLLTGVTGPTTPARADGGGPVERIRVRLLYIPILDDRDPGTGELTLEVKLTCYATPSPCLGEQQAVLDTQKWGFTAGTGDYVHPGDGAGRDWASLPEVLPASAPANPRYDASSATGYPLYPGQNYQISFHITEHDLFTDNDDLGEVKEWLNPENGWDIGEHHVRSWRGSGYGDFEVWFKIERASVPDLVPVASIGVEDVPGLPQKRVCFLIVNQGSGIPSATAAPFEVALRVDGVVPPGATVRLAGLLAGDTTSRCVYAEVPASGLHILAVVVDASDAVIESNETNNIYEQPYLATAPATPTTSPKSSAAPSPTPTPSAALPDLTVSAIKVNGQMPDGKDDCKEGKNTVAAVVKNGSAARADSVVVRLVVDGAQDDAVEQVVEGLDAGQEQEVRFEGVRLKKGEHKLAATVDPKDTIAESRTDNNALKVTAACTATN